MMRAGVDAGARAAVVVILGAALAACGGDADDSASSDARYCEIAVELEQQDEFPSPAQLEAYRDAAPDAIADEVSLIVGRFIEAIDAGDPTTAYSEPAVEDAFAPVEAYEADHCGIEQLP
jgi:hypothetical protein